MALYSVSFLLINAPFNNNTKYEFPMKPSQRSVCVRVSGGLGNQMFQYAAGYALAKHLDARLLLDTVKVSKDKFRDYSLSKFGISDEIIVSDSINWFCRRLEKRLNNIRSLVGGHKTLMGMRLIKESSNLSADEFFDQDSSCYIWGYWASSRFFRGAEDDIRKTFDLGKFSCSSIRGIEMEIDKSPISVGVHVRRGDYESNPITYRKYGLLRRDYYDQSRKLIEEKAVEQPQYYVISDELDKAKEELSHWSHTQFVDGGSQEGDLMLMQKCDHNIIANSTFSWWGAWLNSNRNKIIVKPKRLESDLQFNPDGSPAYMPIIGLDF